MVKCPNNPKCEAFTLIEALLASGILAMVLSAALLPFTVGLQNDLYSGRHVEAVALAQGLMEEIIAKPFYDPDHPDDLTPGPENGESARNQFDNVDDYDGYTEAAGSVRLYLSGLTSADIDPALSRRVTVEYVHLTGQDGGQTANVCRVIVVVDDGGVEMLKLSRLVYGDLEE